MQTVDQNIEALRQELAPIEESVVMNYTLADAIREGSKNTEQASGWGNGATACALSAAWTAAKARDYIK